ncbi:MAG: imidazole glycerol phosphate synthase subunit HisH, partial [Raoultibacter sp.]
MALSSAEQEMRVPRPRIAIVDYRKGNLKSVERGLAHVGGNAFIADDPHEIEQADAIVLPGVGAFADAAATMHALGQISVLRERIDAGVPFLGICLGLHLMYTAGTEGIDNAISSGENAHGLAVLPGVVSVMPRCDSEGACYKIPHVGWNTIDYDVTVVSPLLAGIPSGEYFYFTHSYCAPDTPST